MRIGRLYGLSGDPSHHVRGEALQYLANTCSRRQQKQEHRAKNREGMQPLPHPFSRTIMALVVSQFYEQPLVSPQLMHFRQVPLRTRVNCLQF
jgi:hypothetical protein